MKKLIAIIIASSPVFAFAQQLNDINTVAQKATNIGNLIVQLAISLAVIWIIVGVVKYLIIGSGDDRKAAGMNILYGVIGLFVILSIWGLVFLLTNTFQFGRNTAPTEKINNIQVQPPQIVP